MGKVMHARGDATMAVVGAHDDARRHLRLLALCARMGTVFAVTCDVEDRAEFVLELKRLFHQFFRTRVMVHCGQDREGRLAWKKNVARVAHG